VRPTARAFAAQGAELARARSRMALRRWRWRPAAARGALAWPATPSPIPTGERRARLPSAPASVASTLWSPMPAPPGPAAIAEPARGRAAGQFRAHFLPIKPLPKRRGQSLRAQGFGGQLLFNVSKQALTLGANFGAYGNRQKAPFALPLNAPEPLEGAARASVPRDPTPIRIRSGLLDERLIQARRTAGG